MMKFDNETLQVLKNFATINPSLLFEKGNKLRTISPGKTIMAQAKVPMEIEQTFAIYDLSQLLSTLSLFNNPTIETEENCLYIVSGSERVKYVYAEPSLIISPPNKEIKLPSIDVQFNLSADVFQRTMKAMNIMGAPQLAVVGDGRDIAIQTYDSKNVNSSNYKNKVGVTDKNFTMVFLAENLKLMNCDYQVSISTKKTSHFMSDKIEYWVAVEHCSTVN